MKSPVETPYRETSSRILMALFIALNAIACQCHAQEDAKRPSTAPKEIHFQDFLRKPIGAKGIELSDSLLQSDGQTVVLIGYMVQQEVSSPGRFLLAPQPVQMSQHADGEADDLPATAVLVVLDQSQQGLQVVHTRGRLAVKGVLRVGREEAPDGRVSWIRLLLEPDALRTMNSFELAGYVHSQQHRH